MSIDRVFVIGARLMGHGIAQVSAVAGKRVTLSDRISDLAEKGKSRVAGNLARQVEKEKIGQADADAVLERIGTAEGTDGAAGHDIVIEAVFEDEAVKRETWAALTASADAAAIFASNTSSISITSLATATDRAPRFIGLHFFSPVPVMGLALLLGRRTNPEIRCAGVSLNTSYLDEFDAVRLIESESRRLGLAVADPVRGGAAFERLVAACLA